MAHKLEEERVRRVVEPILSGGEAHHQVRDLEYLRDLGLIDGGEPPCIANPTAAMGYACPHPRTEHRPSMNEPTRLGAASLAEFVRATRDAEFGDGDAERVARLLADTKATLAALADRPRFDAEPADLVKAMGRSAPAAAASGAGEGAP